MTPESNSSQIQKNLVTANIEGGSTFTFDLTPTRKTILTKIFRDPVLRDKFCKPEPFPIDPVTQTLILDREIAYSSNKSIRYGETTPQLLLYNYWEQLTNDENLRTEHQKIFETPNSRLSFILTGKRKRLTTIEHENTLILLRYFSKTNGLQRLFSSVYSRVLSLLRKSRDAETSQMRPELQEYDPLSRYPLIVTPRTKKKAA